MGKAICLRCGATAEAETPEEAILNLDHAVGRTRGIKCGRNIGKVETEGFSKKPAKKSETPKQEKNSE